MGDALKAVILGVIEGLTEFLPVSSTGHLILAMPWLGIDGEAPLWKAFLYFIQIGAILAVVLYFFRGLMQQVFRPAERGWQNHVLTKVFVGVLPAGVIGLALDDVMEEYLEWELPVAIALIAGAAVIVWIEKRYRRTTGPGIEQVSLGQALAIGLIQCVAVIPGTSRSMATIMGGLLVGLPAATAAQFSFYLAIPTLTGAGLYRLYKYREAIAAAGDSDVLLIGFCVSFVVALAAVAGFMRYIQQRSLTPFAVYRVVLGVVVLAVFLMTR